METVAGIKYSKPTVMLLQDTGIGTAEFAARTCYNSFEYSENLAITALDSIIEQGSTECKNIISRVNNIEHSNLLNDLAWTHFHHSILEHANLTYLIKGTSRGALQEHARHRLQAISVRSTRYTMSSVINAFVASVYRDNLVPDISFFTDKILSFNMFVTSDAEYNRLEAESIFKKLKLQMETVGKEKFFKLAIAKSTLNAPFPYIWNSQGTAESTFTLLQAGKKKRNVGDAFKHIVTDNWKVDMVVTMNLRALKNYFQLRDSGAAYFQIQWLAQAIKDVTPSKYLDLIVK